MGVACRLQRSLFFSQNIEDLSIMLELIIRLWQDAENRLLLKDLLMKNTDQRLKVLTVEDKLMVLGDLAKRITEVEMDLTLAKIQGYLRSKPKSGGGSVVYVRVCVQVLLQGYAYRAFGRPRVLKTGDVYNGTVPLNLTGIRISAMRLRSGSFFFQRCEGYTYVTLVVGVLAYDAINLSAVNLPELSLSAQGKPILINFSQVESVPDGLSAQCVWIDLNGLPQFTQLVSSNVCSTLNQGHFTIVAEQTAPSLAPVSPSPTGEVPNVPTGGTRNEGNKSKVWIIVGSVVGGFVLLVLLGILSF
ncbi:hypothetical protein IFM89_028187 [Coptis chinensis]|uniref:Uncharacterized protein n=1 Tax=Coptis chinensis TaxID=261450 RepID=A0A835HG40_9MAGN|nr:hypothetical protein IFM89_028187 [Coptis chinensis]